MNRVSFSCNYTSPYVCTTTWSSSSSNHDQRRPLAYIWSFICSSRRRRRRVCCSIILTIRWKTNRLIGRHEAATNTAPQRPPQIVNTKTNHFWSSSWSEQVVVQFSSPSHLLVVHIIGGGLVLFRYQLKCSSTRLCKEQLYETKRRLSLSPSSRLYVASDLLCIWGVVL